MSFNKQEIETLHKVSWEQFERGVQWLIEAIHEYEEMYGRFFTSIYGIPRGGMCLATKLSYLLGRPLILEKSNLTNDTLVVDDCTNTGKTLRPFQRILSCSVPTTCTIFSMFSEVASFSTSVSSKATALKSVYSPPSTVSL